MPGYMRCTEIVGDRSQHESVCAVLVMLCCSGCDIRTLRKMPVCTDIIVTFEITRDADGYRMGWVLLSPWMMLGATLKAHNAQEALFEQQIMILKEEGNASNMNQAYNQSMAKNDKACLWQ